MEFLSSRKNPYIQRLRSLSRERSLRRQEGEFAADGEKLLREALAAGMELRSVLWGTEPTLTLPPSVRQYRAAPELLRYASPLENSPGPVFTLALRDSLPAEPPEQVLVLEDVRDPGNVGTVLRSAAAFGAGLVVLTGSCADPYNPKTVRASMGALFRQPFAEWSREELMERLRGWGLPLFGAALHREAADIRELPLERCAVAVGNEGSGLSEELLSCCSRRLIIPMAPKSESLNAAVAASVILWEMKRRG